MNTEDQLYFMQRSLELAKNGMGLTRSNPMVGCVIVHQNKIIAEGYHTQYGAPHAEVEAINKVKNPSILKECTLFVTLEPCSHHGKTPPCADLILEKKIPHVIIASGDPNPKVNGNGIRKLKAAGVNVSCGLLDHENRILNTRFFTFYEKKRPYIILKWAQSSDGFIAPENHDGQFLLTNELANILVHQWRSQEAAILVGRKTIEKDNPQLNTRHITGPSPIRLVIDPKNTLKGSYTIFDGSVPTVVFNTVEAMEKNNLKKAIVSENFLLEDILAYCFVNGIQSILVEGGSFTLQQFIQKNLWDEARIFECPVTIENGIAAPVFNKEAHIKETIGNNALSISYHF